MKEIAEDISKGKYRILFLLLAKQTALRNNMTHHDKSYNNKQESGAKTTEPFEKVAKDAGLDPEKALDYREVDQGTNVEPLIESTIKPDNAKTKAGKGSKGKGKGADKGKGFTKKTIREEARCSFCNNLMIQSTKMNYHELTGYRIPKKSDGKTPTFKSPPGAPSGKLVAVFCDDCENALNSGTTYRDFKTAVVEREDGTIQNIPVTDLMV